MAACTVKGQDKDHDKHFSGSCAAAPGDDCDDAAPNVFPGAPEVCDGVDNDCNGKSDFDDGLTAGGFSTAIGPAAAKNFLPAIAWSSVLSVYGIAYQDTTTSSTADLYFEEVDVTGKVTLTARAENDAATLVSADFLKTGLALTWGKDSFGLAWTGTSNVFFRPLADTGAPTMPLVEVPTESPYSARATPSVARLDDGTWAVLFDSLIEDVSAPNQLQANTISATGSVGSAVTLEHLYDTRYGIVAAGAGFVTGSTDGTTALTQAAKATIWSATLASPKPLKLAGTSPIVAAALLDSQLR